MAGYRGGVIRFSDQFFGLPPKHLGLAPSPVSAHVTATQVCIESALIKKTLECTEGTSAKSKEPAPSFPHLRTCQPSNCVQPTITYLSSCFRVFSLENDRLYGNKHTWAARKRRGLKVNMYKLISSQHEKGCYRIPSEVCAADTKSPLGTCTFPSIITGRVLSCDDTAWQHVGCSMVQLPTL
ncbi:hypothetical protein AUEXF2481DRAFT_370491 [Aureobasidium subglaciale EXF-2481]|uniref:Uncharacterized protein n=1 Tax=Aureobasidium subglaciale (strain EXF-2481) TaxID=1043005 RepID=A0A074YLK1_AURSE|nr:uncharacterized protein AUEXF2481DRAFT_370491 [Aureobasidium subglaciale EXF-2481]KEQ98663.1 hypothetical protein AUEXF2481DRAFT_370491 [Aureobasidium subglaciale EXF-2481]